MLKNGLYSLKFRDGDSIAVDTADTMVVIRDGRILGSDLLGGVFSGHYKSQASDTSAIVELQMQVPPESTLVTGHTTEACEQVLQITGTLGNGSKGAKAEVMVLGQRVSVDLTFVGPVPH